MSQRKARLAGLLWALAAGLAVFFAIESAILRRIGLDLFLPVADGALLPGRLARLAASLVAGFALFFTERGRRLSARLRAALQRDRWCWLGAAVVTLVFFLWTCRVIPFSFMTSDESGLLRSVRSVSRSGLQAGANTYSHVLFCWLLSLPYRLDPDGSWYTLYQLGAILVSLTVIGRCILRLAGKRRWSFWAGAAIQLALCVGVFMYSFAMIAYTVTAAIVGSAAVALMLCRSDAAGRFGRLASDVGSVVLLLLCVLERWESGMSLLCFWLLAAAYQGALLWRGADAHRKKQLFSLGGCVLAAVGLIVGARLLAHSELVGYRPSYMDDDASRTLIVDFLVEDLTPEDYAQVGIPPELGSLIYSWYFMDERVTVETFDELAEVYYARHGDEALGKVEAGSLGSYGASLLSQIQSDPQMLWRALCLVSLVCLAGGAALYGGKSRCPELLCSLCALGGAAVLLMHLVIQGRFPTRAFLVVALPAITTVLLMALTAAEAPAPPAGARRWAALGVMCLAGAAAALCCCAGAYSVPHIRDTATADDLFGVQRAIDECMDSDPDTLFITNLYDNNLDPFRDPNYPTNTTFWGNRGDISKAPEKRLFTEDFFRDDVRFMTDQPASVMLLLQFMTLDQGPVQATAVTRLPGSVTAYDFSQVLPEQDGWYEQNGMTYYFRDGQALTGEQVIDGRTYAFAPAGAEAGFTAAPGPDGLVYTTKAYSLIED